eukprot:3147167-Amphidinium_carterae.1
MRGLSPTLSTGSRISVEILIPPEPLQHWLRSLPRNTQTRSLVEPASRFSEKPCWKWVCQIQLMGALASTLRSLNNALLAANLSAASMLACLSSQDSQPISLLLTTHSGQASGVACCSQRGLSAFFSDHLRCLFTTDAFRLFTSHHRTLSRWPLLHSS